MLEYKIDIIEELKKAGVNTTIAKETGVFGQSTMRKFRENDTSISLDNLNRLCCILEMQPRDIIKYIETADDREKIISKIRENKLTITNNSDIMNIVKEGKVLNNKEERNLTEEMSVFKSYLRRLLQDLKDLKEALKNKEYERAETMVDKLIDDTQKGIEDN